jgi:hemoglobin-like flavoprotein
VTYEQIELVRRSFRRIEPVAEVTAQLFYARLFELDPKLRVLFKTDLTAQGHKLMQMIGSAVANLDRLDQLVPAVQALGQRHAAYGVRAEDYENVGAALLWTLEQSLGSRFTPDVKGAWGALYRTLAAAMQAAPPAPVSLNPRWMSPSR